MKLKNCSTQIYPFFFTLEEGTPLFHLTVQLGKIVSLGGKGW